MKFMELFYLMIFFNFFLGLFGSLGLVTRFTGVDMGTMLATLAIAGLAIIGALIIAYTLSSLPILNVSSKGPPMVAVYSFYLVSFQSVYIYSCATIWTQLNSIHPIFYAFYGIVTFVVQFIFVNGMIQLTTGVTE